MTVGDILVRVWGLLSPFVAASIAAYVTDRLSRRRFIQEQWWERKASAYADIIEGLVSFAHSLDRSWEESVTKRGSVAKKEIDTITQEQREARARIERAAIGGDYIISEKAANALSELMEHLDKAPERFEHSWIDFLVANTNATRSCLDLVRRESQRDLGVERERHWWQRKSHAKKQQEDPRSV